MTENERAAAFWGERVIAHLARMRQRDAEGDTVKADALALAARNAATFAATSALADERSRAKFTDTVRFGNRFRNPATGERY